MLSTIQLKNEETYNSNEFIPVLNHSSNFVKLKFSSTGNFISPTAESTSLTSISVLMPNNAFGSINGGNKSSNALLENAFDNGFLLPIEQITGESPFFLNDYLLNEKNININIKESNAESPEQLNSVEEALWALDTALEGEDDFCPDDENILPLACPGSLDKLVENSKQASYESKIQIYLNEVVVAKAEQFVDEIMNCAEKLAQQRIDADTEKCDDKRIFKHPEESNCSLLNKPMQENNEDLNFNSFSCLLNENASTPAVVRFYETQKIQQIGHKLNFDETNSPTDAKIDFFCNNLSAQNDANSYMSTNQKSEDLTIGTPLNTPNEWQTNDEPRNKGSEKDIENNTIIINNCIDKNKTFDISDTEKEQGWFLHKQPIENETLFVEQDATFEIDQETEEDRNKNIARLRFLLGASLECSKLNQLSVPLDKTLTYSEEHHNLNSDM